MAWWIASILGVTEVRVRSGILALAARGAAASCAEKMSGSGAEAEVSALNTFGVRKAVRESAAEGKGQAKESWETLTYGLGGGSLGGQTEKEELEWKRAPAESWSLEERVPGRARDEDKALTTAHGSTECAVTAQGTGPEWDACGEQEVQLGRQRLKFCKSRQRTGLVVWEAWGQGGV